MRSLIVAALLATPATVWAAEEPIPAIEPAQPAVTAPAAPAKEAPKEEAKAEPKKNPHQKSDRSHVVL